LLQGPDQLDEVKADRDAAVARAEKAEQLLAEHKVLAIECVSTYLVITSP